MSYNNAISSGDPQALEKLTAKLEGLKTEQAYMKDVNAYFRKYGTCKGYPKMPDEKAAELDRKVEDAYSWEKQPFPSYRLTNNNSVIKQTEKRITELTRNQEVGFSGWEFNGGRAEANTEMNRLKIYFDERPDTTKCAQMKSNGFKWAPTQGAWQRHLNDNAIYAAGRLDFLKPTDGRTVRDHQPKPPARDGGGAR